MQIEFFSPTDTSRLPWHQSAMRPHHNTRNHGIIGFEDGGDNTFQDFIVRYSPTLAPSIPGTEDRMLVQRYEFGRRKSTGEVVGFSHTVTTTRADWGGSVDTLRMKCDNGKLLVEVRTGRYDDHFDAGDKFYPGANVSNQTWSLRDGKLVVESRIKTYRVDPVSHEMELVNDSGAVKVNTESAKLPLE